MRMTEHARFCPTCELPCCSRLCIYDHHGRRGKCRDRDRRRKYEADRWGDLYHSGDDSYGESMSTDESSKIEFSDNKVDECAPESGSGGGSDAPVLIKNESCQEELAQEAHPLETVSSCTAAGVPDLRTGPAAPEQAEGSGLPSDLTSNLHEVRRRAREVDQDTEKRNALRESFQTSRKQRDYAAALQHWTNTMWSDTPPPVPMANVMKSMTRHQIDTPVILHTLKAYFERYPSEFKTGVVLDAANFLADRLDDDLAQENSDMNTPITFSANRDGHAKHAKMPEILSVARINFVYQKWQAALNTCCDAALMRLDELIVAIHKDHACGLCHDECDGAAQFQRILPTLIHEFVEHWPQRRDLEGLVQCLWNTPLAEEPAQVLLAECSRQNTWQLRPIVEEMVQWSVMQMEHKVTSTGQSSNSPTEAKVWKNYPSVGDPLRTTRHYSTFSLHAVGSAGVPDLRTGPAKHDERKDVEQQARVEEPGPGDSDIPRLILKQELQSSPSGALTGGQREDADGVGAERGSPPPDLA